MQSFRLAAGEFRRVTFTLTPKQLTIVDNQGRELIENGSFLISVGGKPPGFYGKADVPTTQVLTARFQLGTPRPLGPPRSEFRKR